MNDLRWQSTAEDGTSDLVKAGPCYISTTFVESVKLLKIGQEIMNSL
jgi:hypothetical protein